jgi:hypothetical protein
MDLKEFYKQKYVGHWAEELEVGDRCTATIRHKTDGSKNIIDATVIVVQNNKERKSIIGWLAPNEHEIPYNELGKLALCE